MMNLENVSPTSPPLDGHYVDRLIEFNRQRTGGRLKSSAPARIESVGVVGAGVMGEAIAAVTAGYGLPIAITDTSDRVLAGAGRNILDELPDRSKSLVQTTHDLAQLGKCDLIVESVFESLEAKQALFSDLEPYLGPDTILASNTSTIPISDLASKFGDPSRLCGIHFFHPARRRRLVEIIAAPDTSNQTLATTVAYAEIIGKVPLIVADGPGFLVNRLLMPYVGEALQLLREGTPIHRIERVATESGAPWGPFTAMDEIGLDTVLKSGIVLWNAFGDVVPSSPLLVVMVKAGRLGRKTRAGFFGYVENESGKFDPRPDAEVDGIIGDWSQPTPEHADDTIRDRLFLPMVLEATRILAEVPDCDSRLIDLGLILGLGFPESRGGLLGWADSLGSARLVEMLRPLESLGPRMRPTPLLLEMAAGNRRFHDDW
jgi:3-hydroxyacyl-CoA dehydrogenase / enoyl-CoA hydratase / 3-hydroxybutyryl-CoA epimerase / enoyl-CoA isomerase